MALYSDKVRKAVVQLAGAAVGTRAASKSTFRLNKQAQVFDLDTGGYCNRFIRQLFETVLSLPAFKWRFGAERACLTLEKLKPYEVPLKDRQPGDILGFAGNPGHIVLYLGREYDPRKELVAENTSATRGFPRLPGTKVTSYKTLAGRVTGCYRLFA